MATFPPNVERWRPYILKYVPNPQGGVDFWLAWIQRESGGNICSWTTLRESGLFQLMYGDNINDAGTTEELLRAPCVPNTQTAARAITEADIREQMVSFSRYLSKIVSRAKVKLAAARVPWTESDPSFWQVVKLQHAYPAPTAIWLAAATARYGRPPANFAEMRAAVSGYTSVLENAAWVGSFGGKGGADLGTLLALGAAAGLMYYLAKRLG